MTRTPTASSGSEGEVGGLRPEGFDFGNSPTYINDADLSGLTMIHRTSAGTQGVVRSQGDVVAGERLLARLHDGVLPLRVEKE